MDSWNHFTAHILAESSQAPLERRVIESPSGAVHKTCPISALVSITYRRFLSSSDSPWEDSKTTV